MSHVHVPSQELWSSACLCVICALHLHFISYSGTSSIMLPIHVFHLGRFRACQKEWYFILVKGLEETSRFVNCLLIFCLGVSLSDIHSMAFHFHNVMIFKKQKEDKGIPQKYKDQYEWTVCGRFCCHIDCCK